MIAEQFRFIGENIESDLLNHIRSRRRHMHIIRLMPELTHDLVQRNGRDRPVGAPHRMLYSSVSVPDDLFEGGRWRIGLERPADKLELVDDRFFPVLEYADDPIHQGLS